MVTLGNASYAVDPLRFCGPRPDGRHELIARKAYFCSARRDFEPGHELEDWRLAAETDGDRGANRPQAAPTTRGQPARKLGE